MEKPMIQPDPERANLRAQLLAARAALADREVRERALAARVSRWLRTMPVARLAFFWPVRGEPDLTQVIAEWLAERAGRTAALPVVAGEVLEFAAWTPGAPMQPGAYGIPIPATIQRVVPQLILIPCVGIDDRRYRLGYGGGYYDRTAAAFAVRPVLVGVGFDCGRIASIDPQPHDVRLDLAITESGVL
jgi:5-formyltetrahydrofolate cyclo-ligase